YPRARMERSADALRARPISRKRRRFGGPEKAWRDFSAARALHRRAPRPLPKIFHVDRSEAWHGQVRRVTQSLGFIGNIPVRATRTRNRTADRNLPLAAPR